MINFIFNEKKTTQAALLFLSKENENNKSMNYMKLIKLLYLADRDALTHWERPITGDHYVSMKYGPVLSDVLEIINNGEDPENNSYWYKYITTPKNYKIKIKDQLPVLDELSKRETALIGELFDKFKDFDQWDMVNICHQILPEWKDPGNTSKPIEIEEILKEGKKTPDDISRIEEEVNNLNYVKEVLAIND